MKKNVLGNTGIEVTELSFGTLILGKLQADMTPEEAAPTLAKALELGINFFDTAQSYGSQNHLRIGLGSARNEVIIATKTHAKTRDKACQSFEESLRELGREYLDIYHLHLVQNEEDLKNRREILDFFLELKDQGLIRAIGASVHRVEGAKAAAEEPAIEVLFPIINSQGLGIPDGSAQDMIEAIRIAKNRCMGIYAMKPLGGGHLRKNPQEAFRFLRTTGLFDSICAGMKSPAEVEMNIAIFENREITRKMVNRVDTVTRSLKIYDMCIGCGSCVETCPQDALSLDFSRADESKEKKAQSVVDMSKCILCGYCAEVCLRFAIRVI